MNVESLKLKLRLRNFDFLKPKLAMRFLYDADEFYRFRGAEALGYLCNEIALNLGTNKCNDGWLWLWHLSDSSLLI